jgi:restriction system protein
MKLQMARNSLFAILLRSPWWISFAIAVGVVGVARIALPAEYFPYGAFAALPFAVISAVAGWKQLRSPSAARVDRTLEAVRAMSWGEFSGAVEDALRRDGYEITRSGAPDADFEARKAGRVTLVSGKRWKAASTGIKPLRDLHEASQARDAQECIYIAAGGITDNARSFAARNGIRLIEGAALAQWLPPSVGGKRAA